jgi:hypothetical protein
MVGILVVRKREGKIKGGRLDRLTEFTRLEQELEQNWLLFQHESFHQFST